MYVKQIDLSIHKEENCVQTHMDFIVSNFPGQLVQKSDCHKYPDSILWSFTLKEKHKLSDLKCFSLLLHIFYEPSILSLLTSWSLQRFILQTSHFLISNKSSCTLKIYSHFAHF